MPSRKLLATIVAGALFVPHTGFTLGLGEIEVNSALNQKLNADIELLSALPEDTESLIVKLASRKEFSRAGLDRPYLLNDLRFKSEVINGTPHIKVSSNRPIREPFLNFLIEIDWPNGHLLREYTVLLDPPVFMTQSASTVSVATADNSEFRPASVASTNVVPVVTPASAVTASSRPSTQTPASQQKASGSVSTTPAFIPAPVVQQQTPINQPVGSYRIKPGDTAWSLADAMRPDQSISVPQMMIAMLRANPESFINENVNGLKRGYILRLPDYDQIAAISDEDARAMVREQAALWHQYQQSQAGGQPASAMQTDDMPASADAGSSDSMVADNDARLEIAAGDGTSTVSGKDPGEMSAQELRAELSLSRERLETERVEKEALQQRVTTLEQSAEKMKGLLSIEDEELSRVQSLNLPAEETTGEITADSEMVDEVTMDTESMESDAVEEVAGEISEVATAEELAEGAGEDVAADAVFTDEISEQAAAEEIVDAEPVVDTASPQSQLEKRPVADPLTQLLNDPILLAAAGGGLLLIAALIGIMIKRRKAGVAATASGFDNLEVLADEEVTTAEEEVKVESFASEQISADETSELASIEDTVIHETETSAAVEDDKARDDVIAEADVYLAYGIYQQAEDLLKQAITDNPDRIDYRIKLAETHYASKNSDAFIEVATEIKQRVDGDDSAEWKKMIVMGQDLCADNAMFQGAMVDNLEVETPVPETPLMDFDLGVTEDEETSVTSDMDLSLDDESLELPDVDDADSTQIPETEEDEISADMSAEPVDEIEFDLSDTGAVEETTAVEDEFSLDIDASELGVDIQDETENVTDAKEESLDFGDVSLDTDDVADDSMADVEIDFGLDNNVDADIDVSVAETEEEILLDLSDEVEIDSLEDMDVIEDTDAAANDASVEEEDFDLSSLGDVDEVSTKLDLARAYLDMGDHEGTRGILEEVLVDGNDEQKQEANDLMAKLG
ncbi:MAG: hypothetical protein GQ573_06590 [Gammaproteobacteria bacterium]|nr:hypothetical protein [Gammaproteobacteria bacterium]